VSLQRTIGEEKKIEGIGLHTGKNIKLRLLPADADSGVRFKRVDLPDKPIIPALASHLTDASKSLRRTSIGSNGAEIHTIEHLLATLSGMHIDNIMIEIDGPELPGLDGSADWFCKGYKRSARQGAG